MQKCNMRIFFIETGRWRIDGEFGKVLVKIELNENNGNGTLQYCPTHDDCEKLLRYMLEAELRNDNYEFKNPKKSIKYHKNNGNHYRPQELNAKIMRIKNIIAQYNITKINPRECVQSKLSQFVDKIQRRI